MLSYEFWRKREGGDPNIVGRVYQMNNRPHTVIGVLPPIPQYPTESDVYMPTSACPTRASAGFIGQSDGADDERLRTPQAGNADGVLPRATWERSRRS